MNYIDTKFCKECDADYDWACPECPSCVARKSYMQLHNQFLLAKAVIDALPKCDIIDCKVLATRQQAFDELDSGVEFRTSVWRCEEHKLTNGVYIDELDYAPQLRKYLESVKMTNKEKCNKCFDCLDDPSLGLQNPALQQMIVCQACGNKRCRKAKNHSEVCTESNDPKDN